MFYLPFNWLIVFIMIIIHLLECPLVLISLVILIVKMIISLKLLWSVFISHFIISSLHNLAIVRRSIIHSISMPSIMIIVIHSVIIVSYRSIYNSYIIYSTIIFSSTGLLSLISLISSNISIVIASLKMIMLIITSLFVVSLIPIVSQVTIISIIFVVISWVFSLLSP